jgi:hypothetical protein
MFGLFKNKKKTPADAPADAPETAQLQSEAFQALADQFCPEELDILAVTGAAPFAGDQEEDTGLWRAGTVLTAWMEEDSPEIHREQAQLVTLADDKLMDFLRQRVPRDFILKCRVRPALEGERFLLLDLPQPAFDPELKAILEEQKQPVTFREADLGEFTLNRALGLFQADERWLGAEVTLNFDRGEDREACLTAAHALFDDQAGWDGRLRDFAVQKLLAQTGDWVEEGQPPLSRNRFRERLEPESVQVYGDGRFSLWFHDGELLWPGAVRVSGTLTDGPADAALEC